ncbi:MAG: acyl-ACP--UDP-N-acetylglucosamine O-acyltransferase [Planctomycetota bacterium]
MADVHRSAEVGPEVELGDGVVVGPGCVIEGRVTIGEGTKLKAGVYIEGPLRMGAGTVCYPGTTLGYPPQDRSFDPETPGAGTVIGDENLFREGVSVHRATRDTPTTIGDRNYFMAQSHAGHDAVVGNDVTLANGTLLGGHVRIADRTIFGGHSMVHQFCRVGRLSMISGLAGISQDLPPFCMTYRTRTVGSLNVVGLRRSGYRDHIKPMKRAFEMFFRGGLSNASACAAIEEQLGDDPLVGEFVAFIRSAERGVLSYDPAARGGGESRKAEKLKS